MRWTGKVLRMVLFLGISMAFACATSSYRDRLLRDGVHNIEGYTFDPLSTVESRIAAIPASTLKMAMQMDRRNDYLPYLPTADERKMFAEYCEKLPLANKRVMKESLVNIYFIKNFVGGGMTDFVLSGDRKVYTVLYVNAAVFSKGISEWLTYRENSFFIQGANDARVEVDCGKQYAALMYVLLHESAHILDYVHPVTPFVDRSFAAAQGLSGKKTPFVEGVWDDYDVMARKFGITESKDIHAYGITPPVITSARIRGFYDRIFHTPVVSGYSTINWAEDFAESAAFYHLTKELKQPYIVTIFEHGKPVSMHKPMESPAVQQRWRIITGLH